MKKPLSANVIPAKGNRFMTIYCIDFMEKPSLFNGIEKILILPLKNFVLFLPNFSFR